MDNNSFFSVDRLVEFGLGMSMAQQMVNMMNQTMQSMYVPGSMQSMPPAQSPSATPQPQSPQFFVAIDGSAIGPLNEGEIMQLVISKKLTKDTLAWQQGMPDWKPVSEIPAILKIIALTPPPIK